MEEINKNPELDNIDKKSHISNVMNNILSDLEKIKNDYIEVRLDSPYDKSMKERMDGGISALEKAINIVKKCCS